MNYCNFNNNYSIYGNLRNNIYNQTQAIVSNFGSFQSMLIDQTNSICLYPSPVMPLPDFDNPIIKEEEFFDWEF